MNKTIWDMPSPLIFKKQIISLFIESYQPDLLYLATCFQSCYLYAKMKFLSHQQRLLAKCIKLYSWNQMYESSQISGITQFMKLYGKSNIQMASKGQHSLSCTIKFRTKIKKVFPLQQGVSQAWKTVFFILGNYPKYKMSI